MSRKFAGNWRRPPKLKKTHKIEDYKVTEQKNMIYQKILKVQQGVERVPKTGYNSFHKYHYCTEADILKVKEVLNENGLIAIPTTELEELGFKPDGKGWARVSLLYKIIDVETGEAIESRFTGYAEDSFDKAIYKATTGASKYFYLKFFGIETGDDPERDEKQEPPRQRQQRAKFTPIQAGQPQQKPEKNRANALVHANKILALQKQYGLSNEEVLLYGEIDSIRDLAEEGDATSLATAYVKLQNHVKNQRAV